MQIVAREPTSTIESWIIQIEGLAQKAIAELEPKIEASWRGARAAHSRRARLEALAKKTGHAKDIAAAERALRAESRALERAQPDAWFAAKNALTEVQLLRRAVAEGKLEEAVEATFSAMNAAWKLTGEQLDPVVQAGVKARDAAARGGRARAAKRRAGWDQKKQTIRRVRAQMLATGEKSPTEVRTALAERFDRNVRTIDRAFRKTPAKHVSRSPAKLASGPASESKPHERGSASPKTPQLR